MIPTIDETPSTSDRYPHIYLLVGLNERCCVNGSDQILFLYPVTYLQEPVANISYRILVLDHTSRARCLIGLLVLSAWVTGVDGFRQSYVLENDLRFNEDDLTLSECFSYGR